MSKEEKFNNEHGAFTKEDAFQTLNVICNWISNIDTKVSFALAVAGILVGSIFKNELPRAYQRIANVTKLAELNGSDIVASIFISLLYISSFLSIMFFMLAIIARTKNKEHISMFFLGTINKVKLAEYQTSVNALTDEELLLDLEEQIHTNSRICTLKAKWYNRGMRLLIVTIILWFVCMVFRLL